MFLVKFCIGEIMQDIIQFSCLVILIYLWLFYLFFEKWMDWGWEKCVIYHINVWVHFRGQYCSSGHSYPESGLYYNYDETWCLIMNRSKMWLYNNQNYIIKFQNVLSFSVLYNSYEDSPLPPPFFFS